MFLGTAYQWSGGYALLLKKELIGKPLTGMNIGIVGGDTPGKIVLENYLKWNDFKPADFRILPLDNDVLVNNFISGRLRAVVVQERSVKQLVAAGGVVVERSPLISLGMGSYRSRLLDIPNEDIKKLHRGWIKARQWASEPDNWEEYKQIIRNVTLKKSIAVSDHDIITELSALVPFDAKESLMDNQRLLNTELKGKIFKYADKKQVIQNQIVMELLNELVDNKQLSEN